MASGLLLLLFLGCSDYFFVTGPTSVPKETAAVDTGTPPPGTCPPDDSPGYWTPQRAECETERGPGGFSPVVRWDHPTWAQAPSSAHVMSTPIVCPLADEDGDGVPDAPAVVTMSYVGSSTDLAGGTLRVLAGRDGREILSVEGQGLQSTGGVACGDLDGDGWVELVAPTPDGLKCFRADGTLWWTVEGLAGSLAAVSDNPAIGDMDGDGSPEIVVGRAIVSADGRLLGTGGHGIGSAEGAVGSCALMADLENDGRQELVVGNAAYDETGATLWSNGETDGYPAVADLDGDGQGEVAVSGDGLLRLQDGDGQVLWRRNVPTADWGPFGGAPTIADLDGDGHPEIGVAASYAYSAFRGDGSLLWDAWLEDWSSGNVSASIFDFEGDGVPEVIVADQVRLRVLDGRDGTLRFESDLHSSGTWMEYAVVADLDGDGHAEVVVPNSGTFGGATGVTVFADAGASWRPARPIWNQYAWYGGNVLEDGAIPVHPVQPWHGQNTFRAGDLEAGDRDPTPNAFLAAAVVCEEECPQGRLLVDVRAGNDGLADLPAPLQVRVQARMADGDVWLGDFPFPESGTAGWVSAVTRLELDAQTLEGALALTLSLPSTEEDCVPADDGLELAGPFCGTSP